MARLYVLSGADVGRTLDFDSRASVGRIQACDLVLRDGSISRRHAHLELGEGGWDLIDDDSRNGITIGGERRQSVRLVDGQEFLLGEVLLRFRSESPAAVAGPAARETPLAAPARSARVQPVAGADSGLQLEDAEAIDLAAPEVLARTDFARASPKPTGAGLDEQRGRILQYHRSADTRSRLGFELEQLPPGQRALLGLAALALLAGAAWAAFFGAAFLRGKLGAAPADDSAETAPEVGSGG